MKGARHEGEEDDEERAEHELGGVQIRSSVPKQERNQFTEATNVSQLCWRPFPCVVYGTGTGWKLN